MNTLAFIQNIGPMEWIVLLVIALLLFGKRLPEVGKSLGKGIVEFKKGLKGVDDEVEARSSGNVSNQPGYEAGYRGQLPQNNVQTMPPIQQGQPNTVGRADTQH